jgi:hypothetical protein
MVYAPGCDRRRSRTADARRREGFKPAAFLMTPRLLLGLKERAEALAKAAHQQSPHAA